MPPLNLLKATLTLTASALSGWMLVGSLGGKNLPGCGSGSACDAVTRSRWARWGNISVAGVGAVFYLAFAALLSMPGFPLSICAPVIGSFSLIAVGAAMWFTAVQIILLRRLCGYCTAAHICGAIASVLALASLTPWSLNSFPTQLAISGTALATLIGGQIFLKPRTFKVFEGPNELSKSPILREIPKQPAVELRPQRIYISRGLSFLRGKVQLTSADYSILGSPDAAYAVAFLFDFTCEECHHLHKLLMEAVEQSAGNLAVILIPIPLHASCNPAVKCDKPEYKISCTYTRLNWALWFTDRQRHNEWMAYISSDTAPQPYGLALIKARELADISRFELKDADPTLDAKIRSAVKLYQAAGVPNLPTLLLPLGMLKGRVPDLDTLRRLLEKHVSASIFTTKVSQIEVSRG